MVEFCPECAGLLRRKIIDEKPILECRCGYSQEVSENDNEENNSLLKKKEALKNNLIIVKEDDKISIHPKVLKTCSKCKNNEAEAWQEQTRSADEPSTSFFRCTKCKFTWREY